MIRRVFVALAFAVALTGCATQIMRGYMGQTVQEAMLDYGPPSNAFDMPDGSRAFQWSMSSTYVMPTTAQTTSYPAGNVWFSNTTIQGGQAINSNCVYTMLARWDEGRNAWVFYDFRPPNLACE